MLTRLTAKQAVKYRKLDYWELSYATGFTLSEDKDKFEIVTYYGESLDDIIGSRQRPDWIYILANKYMPGILKIGFTTISINQRVNQINGATGLVYPWFPVFGYKCCDGYHLEQRIHKYLEDIGTRINRAREGFEIEIDDAIDIVELIGSEYKLKNFQDL